MRRYIVQIPFLDENGRRVEPGEVVCLEDDIARHHGVNVQLLAADAVQDSSSD